MRRPDADEDGDDAQWKQPEKREAAGLNRRSAGIFIALNLNFYLLNLCNNLHSSVFWRSAGGSTQFRENKHKLKHNEERRRNQRERRFSKEESKSNGSGVGF